MTDTPIVKDEWITIYHGDCMTILDRCIPDNSVDLVFADPPYNIGKAFGEFADKWESDTAYVTWCQHWLSLCLNKLKANGSLYLMASTQTMPYLDCWLRDKCVILSRIIWHYDSSGVQAKKHYGSLYEPILFCVKDKKNYTFNASDILIEAKTGAVRKLIDHRKPVPTLYRTSKIPGNVWYFPRVRYKMPEYVNHPTQKPEALLERIIKASSNPGELILDPFGGSFTTCAVAKALKRHSISMDINIDYVMQGLERMQCCIK
jgi:site-specific DNA-methyltransferase (adenine-specific)